MASDQYETEILKLLERIAKALEAIAGNTRPIDPTKPTVASSGTMHG